MGDLEVVLSDPFGNHVQTLDTFLSATYARGVGVLGSATVTLPDDAYDPGIFTIDSRVEFWRSIAPGRKVLDTETSFLLRRHRRTRQSDGAVVRSIGGPSAVDLLRRRIVQYAANSDEARISNDPCDNMMKLIVRQNGGDLSNPSNRAYASTYFRVAAAESLGPVMSKKFAHRVVLDVLKELSDDSLRTTPVFFDVVRRDDASFEFRTYINQRGTDRSASSTSPAVFSAAAGNLAEEDLDENYEEEVTNSYAGGSGAQADRIVRQIADTERRDRSPFGRCEAWTDGRDGESGAQVDADAAATLIAGRPKRTILGSLLSTETMLYGRDWGFGDRVVAEAFGVEMSVWVNAVSLTLTKDGKEEVSAKVGDVDVSA